VMVRGVEVEVVVMATVVEGVEGGRQERQG
jgi:hypothetical protein